MPILQLIIALLIAATLSLISISSYQNWRTQNTLEQSLELLSNQIELAHTLNITRGEAVYLCASTNATECDPAWRGDLLLFTSANPPQIDQILSRVTLPESVQLKKRSNFNTVDYLRFMNEGEFVYNGSFELTLRQQTICLSVSKTGIAKEASCQNQAAAG